MSLKLQKKKIPYLVLIIFALASAYFFNDFASSERKFLGYPSAPTELKNVAIELKGATFYITKEEAEAHDFSKNAAYLLFILSIVAMGTAYRLNSSSQNNHS